MEQGVQNGQALQRQRVVRSEEQILSLIEEYERCTYTVKEFCELMDVNEATFYSWLKKYRPKPEDEESKGAGFVSVELIPSAKTGPQLFAEVGNIKLYAQVSAEYLKALLS
jgi:transposase-like protein